MGFDHFIGFSDFYLNLLFKNKTSLHIPNISFLYLSLLGSGNITATAINSTAIMVSWEELRYCGSELQVQFELQYNGNVFDTETQNVTVTITNATYTCVPQFVILSGLTPYENYSITLRVTIVELEVFSFLVVNLNVLTLQEGKLS